MKLFGGKKNEKYDMDEYQEDQNTAIPEMPVVEKVPSDEEVPTFTRADMSMPEKNDREEGFINSIYEAVGEAEEKRVDAPVAPPVPPVTSVPPTPEYEQEPTPKKKKSKLKKTLLTIVITLGILVLLGGAAYAISRLWVSQGSMDVYDADFETTDHLELDANGNNNKDDTTVEEVNHVTNVDAKRKDGCYTFLVAGRDVESGCTDVIILGRLDAVNHTINMVSIPRDTMINKGNLKVNSAYQGNLASGGNGIDGLLKEIKKICGFDVDSWAIVDVEAVARLIDAIGGVYFDVPIDMIYKDGSQGLDINIKKGYQLLSGEDAVKVLRFRKGYPNGDLGRIKTQHDFIKAMADQMLDVGNIPNLGAAIKVYQDCVKTNLSAGNVLFYAKEFLKVKSEDINFVEMPMMRGGLVNGQSFVFINISSWLDVVNENLNPYKADITQRNVSIKSSADCGESFFYSAGA